MTISVRLDSQTERALVRLARLTGKTKSEVIRDAIRQLSERATKASSGPTAYDRIADVVGIVNLGPGDRAAQSEEILRAMFAAKRRER